MTVAAKEEGYSDPLGYVSGSMEIVKLYFTLFEIQRDASLPGPNKYIKEQGFLNKEVLDKGFASVSLLLLAYLGAD